MLKLFVFLNILEHPVATNIVLMSPSNTEKSSMIRDYSSTELRNVVFKVNEVLALFVGSDVVEMDILVAPFEVMNDAFIG
jgi:hypothetical protein